MSHHRRSLVSLASTLRQTIPSGVQGSASTTARSSNHLYSSDSHVTDYVAASGMPPIRPGRKVTIHAPPKTPMQSGSAQTLQGGAPAWRLVLEVEPKWANPLLGWTSTADAIETVTRQLQFYTKEDAIAYCDKNGIEYVVEEATPVKKTRPKRFQGYGNNFEVKRLPGGTPIGGLRSERK
mmetsp:Transcript_8112/g.16286  ORF Transcript_8112/g.16286 Transcript_8112/m.16286 type:complete len:180 (+) Transcript_8112:53-592(+)|eukprot:CAMPEP_0118797570 /NCGR_PEP_ID=MMETSP1161-20130426/103_1 /TAXON_ID=249345 /ORGANISM="Picochlorum oklahomensis, Strain CCMP2329" /LENGTH=179 /DNA_ID=CAMNT_0006724771 /DNA_START=39 /DNA_END=578 /DNA_ORIENTATION=+